MANGALLAAVLVVLCFSGCSAVGPASRRLLQAPGTCSGAVATCGTIVNNHDLCNQTPGCEAGKFGNNFNTCFSKGCATFTSQAACTAQGGCTWTPTTSSPTATPTVTPAATTNPGAAVANSCSGTVTVNCAGINNQHDVCMQTAGCQPGNFGNNFFKCFAKACSAFTNQAACTQVGCAWAPPAQPAPAQPLLKIGTKYAFQSDAGGFMFRCNQCTPENGNGFPNQPFCDAIDTTLPQTHFKIVDAGNGLVGLKADNGLFLSRCHDCSFGAVLLDTAAIGITADALPKTPAAHWKVVDAGMGKVAFQSDIGNFLARCYGCYTHELLPNSVTVHVTALDGNPWATWTPVAV